MIREAIESYLTARPPRRLDNLLWVSDLGRHPAKAMNRLIHGQQSEFAADVQVKMDNGSAIEEATSRAIHYACANVLTQFPLYNTIWTGYADFVIGHGTEHVTIIEHKAQGDKGFDYRDSLPRSADVCQLWLYGNLYRERYGITPRLLLFYRGWSNWAEFAIPVEWSGSGHFSVEGVVDSRQVYRMVRFHPGWLRAELESCFAGRTIPNLPESESTWEYAEEAYGRLKLVALKEV